MRMCCTYMCLPGNMLTGREREQCEQEYDFISMLLLLCPVSSLLVSLSLLDKAVQSEQWKLGIWLCCLAGMSRSQNCLCIIRNPFTDTNISICTFYLGMYVSVPGVEFGKSIKNIILVWSLVRLNLLGRPTWIATHQATQHKDFLWTRLTLYIQWHRINQCEDISMLGQ